MISIDTDERFNNLIPSGLGKPAEDHYSNRINNRRDYNNWHTTVGYVHTISILCSHLVLLQMSRNEELVSDQPFLTYKASVLDGFENIWENK